MFYMRIYLPIICMALCFSSCTTHYYTTIDSNNTKKNAQSIFVDENDTLRIEYNFSIQNGRVGISIFNKTKDSVTINWQQSALMTNGQTFSYYNADTPLDVPMMPNNNSVSITTLIENALIKDSLYNASITYIAPQTWVAYLLMPIAELPGAQIKKAVLQPQKVQTRGVKYTIQKAGFTSQNTPLHFSSLLTFQTIQAPNKPFIHKHDFYIKTFIKTNKPTKVLYKNKKLPGNVYQTTATNNFNKIMYIVGSTITLLSLVMPET
jgi:hypothetical protein